MALLREILAQTNFIRNRREITQYRGEET